LPTFVLPSWTEAAAFDRHPFRVTVENLKGARGFSAGHFLRVRGTTIVAEMPALGGLGVPQTSGLSFEPIGDFLVEN